MRRILPLVIALFGASLVVAEEKRRLNGEFHWMGPGVSGELEAVFTPREEGSWNVDFHFEFRGSPHVYSGTAVGSLSQGKLEGQVQNESGKRTFTFAGSFEDGTFKGKHHETTGGREAKTGTLRLSD